jgi:Predicted metal-dependent hydrolase with the TIM-barrel fold
MMVANTLALARCLRPEGEFVDRERGHLWEEAVDEVLALVRPERETLVEAVAEASRFAASLGITAVADMPSARDLPAFQVAERRGLLRTRIFAYLPVELLPHITALGIHRGYGSPFLRIVGVKAFVDGSIGAKTAALLEPYRGELGRGRVLLGRGELARLWRKAMEAGLQMAIHAIGDRAIEEVLAAARLAGSASTTATASNTSSSPLPPSSPGMKDLGLLASMQPNFCSGQDQGRCTKTGLVQPGIPGLIPIAGFWTKGFL